MTRSMSEQYESYVPSPAELARYDQIHAENSLMLDNVIQAFREELADDAGTPREVHVAALAMLLSELCIPHLANMLAIAIDRSVRL